MYGNVPLTWTHSRRWRRRVGPLEFAAPTCLAKPKSRTLTRPSDSNDDICRLQIAMNDAPVMGARECAGNLNAISED